MSPRAWFYALALSALLWATLWLGTAPAAPLGQPWQLAAVQTAWQWSPCTNRIRVYWDPTLAAHSRAGEASGIRFGADGASWQRVSCDIALDPAYWMTIGRAQRAKILLHEAGHLAGYVAHSEDRRDVMFLTSSGCRPFCGKYGL